MAVINMPPAPVNPQRTQEHVAEQLFWKSDFFMLIEKTFFFENVHVLIRVRFPLLQGTVASCRVPETTAAL